MNKGSDQIKEPSLDALIEEFGNSTENNVIDILSIPENLQNFIIYSGESNRQFFVKKITALDDEKKFNCIKNLVSLYPLSANILFQILVLDLKSKDMKKDLLAWFDVSDTMKNFFNKFNTFCNSRKDIEESTLTLDKSIKRLEISKNELTTEIEKLKNMKIREKALYDEVSNLRNECNELKAEYGNLEEKKINLKNEIENSKKNVSNAAKDVKKLQNELEKSQNTEDGNFKNAMGILRNIVKEMLPEDEVDKNG